MNEKALNEAVAAFAEAFEKAMGERLPADKVMKYKPLLQRAIEKYLEVAGSNE